MINNYVLRKIKGIFQDGISEAVEFLFCGGQVDYIAIISGDKVDLNKKKFDGGSSRVDIKSYKKAALEYFKNNEFEIITDYRKNN